MHAGSEVVMFRDTFFSLPSVSRPRNIRRGKCESERRYAREKSCLLAFAACQNVLW